MLRQQSTTTYCNQLERNCVRTFRQHRTSNSHRAELEDNPLMVDPVKDGTEVNLNNYRFLPRLQVCDTQEHYKCQDFSYKLSGWLEAHTHTHIYIPLTTQDEQTPDAEILWTLLVLRKLVCNWPLRRKAFRIWVANRKAIQTKES